VIPATSAFEHVTGKTRVFAQNNFWTRAVRRLAWIHLREHVRRSAAKLLCRLRRYRLHVRNTTHTVCAKYLLLLGHGLIETLESQFVNGKF